MAKKKTKKNIKLSDNYELTQKVVAIPKEEKEVEKKESIEVRHQALITKMLLRMNEQDNSIKGLMQRIDRIVAALDKSKSVRGL